MRLKRFQTGNDIIIAVEHNARWIPLDKLDGFTHNHLDTIEILDQWEVLKPEIDNALAQPGNEKLPGIPEGASPILPFEPRSFRDFMLSEKHAIDAGHGMVKHFLPALYPVIQLYEKITRRTFPALRPKPIWYRQPVYYMGNHLNFVTDGNEIKWPSFTNALDYELEMGFVITKPLKDADREDALKSIGGFVIVNDFSARDVQLDEMRSGLGPQKAKHFINAMSAEIIPADEVLPFIDTLKASVQINGERLCSTQMDFQHHSIADVLVHVSMSEQLHPGELFAMGTLPGGCALENDCWLKPGDCVELSIERIGTLTNVITR